jgi:hypothetical protein
VWVEHAARNNAEWCDSVCATQGIRGSFHEHLWACGSRTPDLYPDAVTLDRAARAADVLEHVDTSTPGCSVKDSFSALDLRRAGFRVLFDATWMARTGAVPDDALPDRWSRVTDAQVLERWRRASGCDLDDALLDRDEIVILAGRESGPDDDDDIVAGGVLNRSESVVGISNVFALDHDLDRVWPACLAFAGDSFSAVPVVGYEAGAPLASACRHGFEAVGQLRVWIDDRVREVASTGAPPVAKRSRAAKMKE